LGIWIWEISMGGIGSKSEADALAD
jgi:hypothetical protein